MLNGICDEETTHHQMANIEEFPARRRVKNRVREHYNYNQASQWAFGQMQPMETSQCLALECGYLHEMKTLRNIRSCRAMDLDTDNVIFVVRNELDPNGKREKKVK